MRKKIRWGILGAANIAVKKVIPAMQAGEFCEIAAIASRSFDDAGVFCFCCCLVSDYVLLTWGGGLPGRAPSARRSIHRCGTTARAGAPLRAPCVGAFDYPEPQPGNGWNKLAVKLAGGPRQSAGRLQGSNSLVRTLVADAAGVTELWWDGRDELGELVAAGPYHVKTLTHDVRLLDDGSFGDNGSPLGATWRQRRPGAHPPRRRVHHHRGVR